MTVYFYFVPRQVPPQPGDEYERYEKGPLRAKLCFRIPVPLWLGTWLEGRK